MSPTCQVDDESTDRQPCQIAEFLTTEVQYISFIYAGVIGLRLQLSRVNTVKHSVTDVSNRFLH